VSSLRPYSKGQKIDFRDAEAIAEAVQRPTTKFVPTKAAEQLDLQALHRVRELLVCTAWRTLAAAAGLAGDHAAAVRALVEAKRLQPSLSVDWVEKYYLRVRAEHRTLYINGLRTAGVG
jgi:hypothetical protein